MGLTSDSQASSFTLFAFLLYNDSLSGLSYIVLQSLSSTLQNPISCRLPCVCRSHVQFIFTQHLPKLPPGPCCPPSLLFQSSILSLLCFSPLPSHLFQLLPFLFLLLIHKLHRPLHPLLLILPPRQADLIRREAHCTERAHSPIRGLGYWLPPNRCHATSRGARRDAED